MNIKHFYNQNYSFAEIEDVLSTIQACIAKNQYTISLNDNRQENIAFINKYNIRSNMQKAILMNIEPKDFCHSLKNTKPGYEHEVLYVFAPQVQLFNTDGKEITVVMYAKFNIINLKSGDYIVVISFHELNRPIKYLFR